MKKQEYQKPTVQVVQLHHHLLLAGSLTQASTNLSQDNLEFNETPQSTWGR